MSGILLGALAIIAGLIFCFRGYLALRTVIAIWGAFVGFASARDWPVQPPETPR